MATRVYRLYSAALTTSADNKASLRISKRGRINAVCATANITQAADVTGVQRFEISKQSASSFAVNDTPNSVLCHFSCGGAAVASQSTHDNILVAGLDWQVENGDTIYLHELLAGTAPTSGTLSIDIFVSE
jgi:hypothetical protein